MILCYVNCVIQQGCKCPAINTVWKGCLCKFVSDMLQILCKAEWLPTEFCAQQPGWHLSPACFTLAHVACSLMCSDIACNHVMQPQHDKVACLEGCTSSGSTNLQLLCSPLLFGRVTTAYKSHKQFLHKHLVAALYKIAQLAL